MAEEEKQTPRKTPHDTLIEALEKVDQMGEVIIIWEHKDGNRIGSITSELTSAEVLWDIENYKRWLLSVGE